MSKVSMKFTLETVLKGFAFSISREKLLADKIMYLSIVVLRSESPEELKVCILFFAKNQ